MAKQPNKCPSCSATLVVTQLCCPNCATEVRGNFETDLFSRLSPEDFDFVVLFVKTKGNIKEMERELGISYWTIRSKLNEVVDQLGLEAEQPDQQAVENRRQAILEQLSAGEITAKEAANLLRELKSKS